MLRELGENIAHDVAVDVGEAVVAALVFVGEFACVDTEQEEDRGLQIVDVDGAGTKSSLVGEIGLPLSSAML